LDNLKIGDFILNRLPDKITNIVKDILNSNVQKSSSTEVEVIKHELFIEAFCSRVPRPDGSLAGVVLAIRNISEFKKIETLKSQFVSMVAHELKTPVSAVLGFLDIINDEKIEISKEKEKEFLERSATRLKGLLDLVNDLLDISRMELGTKQREIVDIKIDEAINSTLLFLEIQIKEKGITVSTDFEDNLPAIKVDQNEINRVFTNILSNAIKYNKDNGSIKIAARTANNYVNIEISDTGIGLKPEEKNQLFQQFYRAKNGKTRGISGTGLGLSIVKQIVESYHGKIEVESEWGIGTKFSIYLPLNK